MCASRLRSANFQPIFELRVAPEAGAIFTRAFLVAQGIMKHF